jgi:hypothetical protein
MTQSFDYFRDNILQGMMLGGNVTGNIGSLGGGFRDTEATYESIGGNSQIVNQLSQMK